MRIAVVGCGLIGRIYVQVLRDLGHDVVAVVDVDASNAAAVATAPGAAFTDVDGMLASGIRIDVVGISTPPDSHADLIRRFAELGIPVLCEKPLALDGNAARRAVTSCDAAGVPLAVGFKMRFERIFQRVRQVLVSDEIGALRHLHITHYQEPRPGAWSAAVGVTAETLSHAVDLANWLMEAVPITSSGQSNTGAGLTHDAVSRLHLVFDGGRDATLAGGWIPGLPTVGGTHDHLLLAVAERGYVLAVRPGTVVVQSHGGRRTEALESDYRDPFRAEWQAFTSLVRGQEAPDLARGADALAVQDVLDRVGADQLTTTWTNQAFQRRSHL